MQENVSRSAGFEVRHCPNYTTQRMHVLLLVLAICLLWQPCSAFLLPPTVFTSVPKLGLQKAGFPSLCKGLHVRIVSLSAGKAGAYAHKKRPVAGGGKSKVRTPSTGESPPPLLNPDGTAALVSANGKKLKEDVIEVQGRITDALPGTMFRVEIEPSKQSISCTISGKIRKNNIKLLVGDFITAELSIFDLTKGRITFRKRL